MSKFQGSSETTKIVKQKNNRREMEAPTRPESPKEKKKIQDISFQSKNKVTPKDKIEIRRKDVKGEWSQKDTLENHVEGRTMDPRGEEVKLGRRG